MGISWVYEPNKTTRSELGHLRSESKANRSKFALIIGWAYVCQTKDLLTDRHVVFWTLDFWFPVLLGLLALKGNAQSAVDLVARVLTGL